MSEEKYRVLIVHNRYQIPGGEDTVVANEKKLLEDHGHEVILYTQDNNELRTMKPWRKLLLPFTTIYNPRTARDIKRIIREERVDIVHVHNTLNLISPAVYYAALKCGVPVVQTIHNFRMLCPGATFYRDGHICEDCVTRGLHCAVKHGCYRGSKAQTLVCVVSTLIHRWTGIYGKINYITLTDFNRDKLLQLKQIRPERVFVKPNFVEGKPENVERDGFIFVGRLDELKGVRTLIEAWRMMGDKAPRLTICGTGPLEDWCREQSKGLNIELKGFVPNSEARKLIGRSKALVLPTLWYEGFPMSIVEAYSMGTPVICSDLGNAGSLVEENVTGWKFQLGSAEALIGAIVKWKDITGSVIKRYNERYTSDSNYSLLMEIYEKSARSC